MACLLRLAIMTAGVVAVVAAVVADNDADDAKLSSTECQFSSSPGGVGWQRIEACSAICCDTTAESCLCMDELVWSGAKELATNGAALENLKLASKYTMCEYAECIYDIAAECRAVNYSGDVFAQHEWQREFQKLFTEGEYNLYCNSQQPICGMPNIVDEAADLIVEEFADCLGERMECIDFDIPGARCTSSCVKHHLNCSKQFDCRYHKDVNVCAQAPPYSAICREEETNLNAICTDILSPSDGFDPVLLIILLCIGLVVICCVIAVVVGFKYKKQQDLLKDQPVAPPCKDAAPQIKYALENGSWSKGKLLGKGQFGAVYMVLLPNGKSLAAKIINTGESQDDEMRAYVKEITNMRDLDHKNIVKYYYATYNAAQSEITLFMEYVQGGSLGRLVRSMDARLSEEQGAVYMAQIVSGIDYLHSKGIIHRDIKGDNVLVDTNEGVCKISDFGSSKKLGTVAGGTVAKTITGTPNWMAPEVITNAGLTEHSEKVDIWSIGATCIELLDQGRPPWPKFTTHWAAVYHIGQEGASPDIPGWMSYDCKDFVSLCLQRNPDLRPTCRQLVNHPFIKKGAEVDSELSSDDSSVRSVDSNVGKLIDDTQLQNTKKRTASSEPHVRVSIQQASEPQSSLRTVANPSVPTTLGTGGSMQTAMKSPDDKTIDDQPGEDSLPKFTGNFGAAGADGHDEDDVRFTANFQVSPHDADDVQFTTIPPQGQAAPTAPFE